MMEIIKLLINSISYLSCCLLLYIRFVYSFFICMYIINGCRRLAKKNKDYNNYWATSPVAGGIVLSCFVS